MITVVHICGHSQGLHSLERIAEKSVTVLGKSKEQFIQAQLNFLESNLCPSCYTAEKEKNSEYKPIGG